MYRVQIFFFCNNYRKMYIWTYNGRYSKTSAKNFLKNFREIEIPLEQINK